MVDSGWPLRGPWYYLIIIAWGSPGQAYSSIYASLCLHETDVFCSTVCFKDFIAEMLSHGSILPFYASIKYRRQTSSIQAPGMTCTSVSSSSPGICQNSSTYCSTMWSSCTVQSSGVGPYERLK